VLGGMEVHVNYFFSHYYDIAAVILFGIGFTIVLLHRNLMHKLVGMNIMDVAIFLFLAVKGYISGRKAPIIIDDIISYERYINPVPSGLVLTGIVVAVCMTAFGLALIQKIYLRYHTLDIDEILVKYKGVK